MGKNMQSTQICTERIFILWSKRKLETGAVIKVQQSATQRANQLCFYTVPLTENKQLVGNGLFSQIRSHIRTVGSDLSDIYLSGNLIYPTEDWGTKCAAYYCIDTFLSDI